MGHPARVESDKRGEEKRNPMFDARSASNIGHPALRAVLDALSRVKDKTG